MKKFLLIMGFISICHAEPDNLYSWKVIKVVDGDTVQVQTDFLPVELGNHLLLRIYGVDTPEKGWRAKDDHERQVMCWDKYGGRLLGDVIIDGESLRQLLLENKYAREYYGDKKQNWSDYDNSK